MASHFLLLVLFAGFVSIVFSVLAKDDVGDQVRLGSKMFGAFLVAALVLGWMLYPVPF